MFAWDKKTLKGQFITTFTHQMNVQSKNKLHTKVETGWATKWLFLLGVYFTQLFHATTVQSGCKCRIHWLDKFHIAHVTRRYKMFRVVFLVPFPKGFLYRKHHNL